MFCIFIYVCTTILITMYFSYGVVISNDIVRCPVCGKSSCIGTTGSNGYFRPGCF